MLAKNTLLHENGNKCDRYTGTGCALLEAGVSNVLL
jgi:hypothetical protein